MRDQDTLLTRARECAVTLWSCALLIALLPILVSAFAVLISLPIWLGCMTWGVALDLCRRLFAPVTPELPQQFCTLLGLW